MIERTPLPRGRRALRAVGGLRGAAADRQRSSPRSAIPRPRPGAELEPEELRRAEALVAALRAGPEAPSQIPRDLAALQRLVIEAVRREVPEREPGRLRARRSGGSPTCSARSRARSPASLVESRGGAEAAPTRSPGCPARSQLDEWLQRPARRAAPLRAHVRPRASSTSTGSGGSTRPTGATTGDRMLAAVAGVLRRQLRDVDQAFRLEEDEFAILAPHTDAAGLVADGEADRRAGRELAVRRRAADRDRLRGRRLPRGRRRAPSACSRAPPRRPTPRRRLRSAGRAQRRAAPRRRVQDR